LGSRYQAQLARSRGFRVLQSPFTATGRRPIGLPPPLSSFELSPGTLGSSPSRRRRGCAPQSWASPALRCHLSVLPFLGLRSYRRARSIEPTLPTHLAEAPCPFSIFGIPEPFFSPLTKRRRRLPPFSEVPPSGFGYPLDGVSPENPRGPLSAPNAPGVPPPEPSSSPVVESGFPQTPSLLPLRKKPTSFSRRLQGFPPTEEAESLLRSPED
jgi:hypothetical protein